MVCVCTYIEFKSRLSEERSAVVAEQTNVFEVKDYITL